MTTTMTSYECETWDNHLTDTQFQQALPAIIDRSIPAGIASDHWSLNEDANLQLLHRTLPLENLHKHPDRDTHSTSGRACSCPHGGSRASADRTRTTSSCAEGASAAAANQQTVVISRQLEPEQSKQRCNIHTMLSGIASDHRSLNEDANWHQRENHLNDIRHHQIKKHDQTKRHDPTKKHEQTKARQKSRKHDQINTIDQV